MPTYDYHCETCGNDFEHFQSMSSPKLTTCLEEFCRGEASGIAKGQGVVVRKISGGAGLVFNGDGFYVTDYVKKDSGSSSKSGTGTDAKSDGKADTKAGTEPSSSASAETSAGTPSSTASATTQAVEKK
jgi:putative FmdB family regulatory protein